jgi:hypothetical protein
VSGGDGILARAGRGSMDKWLCWGAFGVSSLMFVIFLLDLLLGWPFGRVSATLDIFALIAALLVAYLAWDTYKEVS